MGNDHFETFFQERLSSSQGGRGEGPISEVPQLVIFNILASLVITNLNFSWFRNGKLLELLLFWMLSRRPLGLVMIGNVCMCVHTK